MLTSRKYILLFFSFCLLPLWVADIYAENVNYISVGGSLGYDATIDNLSTTKNGLGVAPAVFGGYALRHDNFLLSVSLSAQYAFTSLKVNDAQFSIPSVDPDGDEFSYTINLTNRVDRLQAIEIGLPILFGAQIKRAYFMVGPKLNLTISNYGSVNCLFSSSVLYDKAIDPFENMPNHLLYSERPYSVSKQNVSFRPNVNMYAEIGAEIGDIFTGTGYDVPKPKQRYYLALFAESSLLNQIKHNPTQQAASVNYDGTDFQVILNHQYNAVASQTVWVRNFVVGLKFTCLFRLPEKKSCVMCNE